MKEKFIKNMGYLIVLLDVVIYFILSYVNVDGLQDNLFSVFVNGILLFVGAIIATSSMTTQGLLNGGDTEKYKETVKAFIKENEKIAPKIKYLQAWLDQDYYRLLKIGRGPYLNSIGFEYNDVFTDKGKLKSDFKIKKPLPVTKYKIRHFLFSDEWKRYREQKRLLRVAKRYKVTRLKVMDVTTIDSTKDPNDFGDSEKKYISKKSGINILSRLIFSCLLPTIMWGYLGFNVQTFITQIINIALILISALWSMYCAYSFKVKTHRNNIIKKINKLEEFYNSNVEELKNDICKQESVPAKSNLVEEIHRECESKQENNLCSD